MQNFLLCKTLPKLTILCSNSYLDNCMCFTFNGNSLRKTSHTIITQMRFKERPNKNIDQQSVSMDMVEYIVCIFLAASLCIICQSIYLLTSVSIYIFPTICPYFLYKFQPPVLKTTPPFLRQPCPLKNFLFQ